MGRTEHALKHTVYQCHPLQIDRNRQVNYDGKGSGGRSFTFIDFHRLTCGQVRGAHVLRAADRRAELWLLETNTIISYWNIKAISHFINLLMNLSNQQHMNLHIWNPVSSLAIFFFFETWFIFKACFLRKTAGDDWWLLHFQLWASV